MLEKLVTIGELEHMSIDDVAEWTETLDVWQDAEHRAAKKAEQK